MCNLDNLTQECNVNDVTYATCTITQFNEKFFTYAGHNYTTWFAFQQDATCKNLTILNVSVDEDVRAFLGIGTYYNTPII